MRAFIRWAVRIFGVLIVLLIAGLLFWASGQNRELDAAEQFRAADIAPGQFVTVNGRQMHVLISGDPLADPTGAPLVLLHGFSASGHTTWLPWAERLETQRSVIYIDMLNFGYSERVTNPHHDLTHAGQAALIEGVLGVLGVANMDLVGWSMGGAMAAQYTLLYPRRVRALAFVAAHIYGINRFNPFQALGDLPLGVGRAMSWNSVGGSPNGFVARTCRETGEQCNWLEPLLIEGTVDALRAISATEQDTLLPDDVPQIDKRALVIAGETDNIVPLADNARLVAELGAEYCIAEGAGHWPGERNPDGLAQQLIAFFAPGESASAATITAGEVCRF